MEGLRTAVTMLFRLSGKGVMTPKEFVFSASIDHRWFSPKDAQRFLDVASSRGLVDNDGEYVRPSFDTSSVDVPVGFTPDKEMLGTDAGPLFPRILGIVAEATGSPKREVMASMNRERERLGVDIEVAGLAVASSHGIDVADLVVEARREILSR